MTGLAGFASWLALKLEYVVIKIYNAFIFFVNNLVDAIALAGQVAINLLPTYTAPSPGQLVAESGFLSALNWVLPITFFIDVITMMIFAYILTNTLGPIFRWTKLIRG